MSHTKQGQERMPLTQTGRAEDSQRMVTALPSAEVKSPAVDSGLLCWLQVVGSFAMWANSWGVVNSFGAIPYTCTPVSSTC